MIDACGQSETQTTLINYPRLTQTVETSNSVTAGKVLMLFDLFVSFILTKWNPEVAELFLAA